jgi:hypothetical protein
MEPNLFCDHIGCEILPGGEIVRMRASLRVTASTDPVRMSLGVTLDTRRAELLQMDDEDRLSWLLARLRERVQGELWPEGSN